MLRPSSHPLLLLLQRKGDTDARDELASERATSYQCVAYSQCLGSSPSCFYGVRDPSLSPILSHCHCLPPPRPLNTRKQKQCNCPPTPKSCPRDMSGYSHFVIQHSPCRDGWKSSNEVRIHYLLFRRHFRSVLEPIFKR